jgi:hypothetical protein
MAIAAIEGKGGKSIHLPPQGKYLNPAQLPFKDLKKFAFDHSSRKTVKISVDEN